MRLIKDIQTELAALDTSVKSIRRFVQLMLVICILALLSGYYFQNPLPLIAGSVGFFIFTTGIFINPFGRILHNVWMGLAFFLGWISSRVLLFLIYYLVVTPIALLARITGKRFLDTRFRDGRASYWIDRKGYESDYTKMS